MKGTVKTISYLRNTDRKTPFVFPISFELETEDETVNLSYVEGSRLSPYIRSQMSGLKGKSTPIYFDKTNLTYYESFFLIKEENIKIELQKINKIN